MSTPASFTSIILWAKRPVSFFALVAVVAVAGLAGDAPTAGGVRPKDRRAAMAPVSTAHAADQIGAFAGSQYSGDGLSVVATPAGARLRSDFQKLNGDATRGGLWVTSTARGEDARLHLMATEFGRGDRLVRLARSGTVVHRDGVAAYVRRGLTEEYSTSVDGVRQDFIVHRQPSGVGRLQVNLALTGATATQAARGAILTLDGSGRALAYSRLHVADATGRTLEASLDVTAADSLSITVNDQDAVYPVRIDPTFSDADWVRLNPVVPGVAPGINQARPAISAMLIDGNGHLIVAGTFTVVGDRPAARIAKWDGVSWSTFGEGFDGDVRALAQNGTDLYAAGDFLTAGGVAASRVARWNGSEWTPLGAGITPVVTGVSNAVHALAFVNGALYAGGAFQMDLGGNNAAYIAKWNGATWSPLAGGGTSGPVHALAAQGGVLYVGGQFTTAGGVSANRVAAWDTTTSAWSSVGQPSSTGFVGMNNTVHALTVSGATLYAGGAFTTAGGVTVNRIARLESGNWQALGTGIVNQSVYALAVSGSTVYVGGSFADNGRRHYRILQWDGSGWVSMAEGTDPGGGGALAGNMVVAALAIDAGGNVYAGGNFARAGSTPAANLAKWDGSTWEALGASGITGRISALALDGSSIYIGGEFQGVGGVAANRIARWNGSEWSALGSGIEGVVNAIAVRGNDVFVAGGFTSAGGVTTHHLARWNGTTWMAMNPTAQTNAGVYALLFSSSDELYVGGWFTRFGPLTGLKGIAKWNPTTGVWSNVGAGGFDNGSANGGAVFALAEHDGDIYAGGNWSTAAGVSAPNIARWNGTSWSALGSGTSAPVYALTVMGSSIYVAGRFGSAGGQSATRGVAKWSGSHWESIGAEIDFEIGNFASSSSMALATDGANLYVAGNFSSAGGQTIRNLAKWDGAVWSGFGSGPDATARALAVDSTGTLIVGGDFGMVGSVVSPFLASWSIPPNRAPSAHAGVDQVVPATSAAGASVTLVGTGSSDPDGDSLTYTWTEGVTVVGTGATLTTTAAIGSHTFTLTVDDGNGFQASDDVVIEVRDVLSVTAATPPITPATYTFGQTVLADYACNSSGGLLATCSGTVAIGAAIDTSAIGTHPFQVTATNTLGDTTTSSWTYEVTKAPSTVTVHCPASSAYTGGTQTPCTATASGAGMVPVDVSASLVYLNNSGVGTATVSANWAGDATHVGSTGLGNFNIVTAPVTAVLTANSKVYDGTTSAPNIGLSCALAGVAPVDAGNVVCSPSAGVFDNPNVGSPRSVTATLTLTGSAAGNYTFGASGTNVPSTVAANAPTSTTASAVYGQAGDFTTGVANNGGVSASSLASARGVAADVDGNIYVADRDNNRVLFFPFGQTTATRVYGQAGSFTTNTVNNGGLSADSLRNPTRVSVDSHGGLYVSDPGNFRVLYFPPGSTTATRVYGQLGSFTTAIANNGGISADSLGSPRAVAIDADDNVYIADATNSRVLFYPAGSTTATRVYGQNGNFTTGIVNNTTGVAGVISAESLNTPNGIRLDTDGNLYVVDQQNNRVLMYPAGQTTATVVYGQGGSFVTNLANNGGISADSLSTPSNLAVDGGNNVYVGDQGNARVLFFPSGQTTATVVYGQFGSFATGTPNNGGASADSLANPNSVDLDFAGNIYVSDFGNNRVLRFTGAAPAITPATLVVTASSSTKTYGTTASVTPSYSGFVNGETPAVLSSQATCSSAGTAASAPVGTYPVTCTGAVGANYSISHVAGTLTVEPAPASVTPNPASKVYGTLDPVLTGTLSGFLPGDGVTATFSRTSGETVAGGPYTISATLSPAGVLANYAITYHTAAFTILKASQTISLGAAPSAGVPDTAFSSATGTGFNARTISAAVQADGKIVVGGTFSTFNGVAAPFIARLNPDGTRDAGFTTAGTGFDSNVNAVAVQVDGKIVVGGNFQVLNGSAVNFIARLNSNGAPDGAFITNTGTGFGGGQVMVVALQPDGKILAGGFFSTQNGVSAKALARLNADGTPDTAFRANLGTGFNGDIRRLAIQPDGKIVVAGNFTSLNGLAVTGVARVNADGTPDTAFNANTGAGTTGNQTLAVALQPDGKVVVGGLFTHLNGVLVNGIGRLNADGTPDTAFSANVTGLFATSLAVQPDGKIVASGGSKGVTRRNGDGTADTAFVANLGTGLNGPPENIVLAPNGSIILVNSFTSLNGATANRIARLSPGSGAITKTFGDAPFAVSASASSGLPVTFSSTTPTVCTASGNLVTLVGAGACTLAVSQGGDSNYEPATTVNQDVTVTKASSTTTVTCAPATSVYAGAAQELCTVSVTGAGGLSLTPTPTYTNNTNVGTATASYSYAGDANHDASTGSATFEITKAGSTTTVTCAPATSVYTGAAQELCAVSVTGAGGLSLTPTPTYTNNTNVGTATATYSFAGDANHDASTGSATFEITKATSTTAVTCAPTSSVYTGAAQELCAVSVTGAGSLSLTPTPTYTNNTNVGTATASYSYAGDANHDASTGSATFEITKARSTTAVTCAPATSVYTGAAQELCTVSVTGAGALSLTPTPTYTNNTNVGTATASYSYAGDANHDASTGSATFEITKATSTTAVTCAPATSVYTGAAQELCAVSVTGAGSLSLTPTPTYTNKTNVGTATASYSYAGDANHDASTGSATFEITKARSTTAVTCAPATSVYTGAAQELCTVSVTGAGGLNLTPTPSYTNNTNVGTATASYSYAGDANHDASTGSATFEITKAPLTVTADNATRAALAPNPVFTGVLTGVLGTDGITATYSAPAATLPGSYAITPALVDPNGRLANYIVSSTNGTLTVVDLDPPTLTVPAAAVVVEATSATGAVVDFAATVTAVDAVFGPVTVTCTPASGTTFAIGTTTVQCSAADAVGNVGAASFDVTVQDTTAPTLTAADITVVASDPAGRAVTFSPMGEDLVDGQVASTCSPTSDTVFTIGSHVVTCSATDEAGNVSESVSFTVHVLDGVLPVVTVPTALTAEATGATGAAVTFAATAADNIDETLTTTCLPASGAVFALGDTTVTCTATDAAGNIGTASFIVTVRDTVAPTLQLPTVAPVVSLTPTTPVTYSVSASDIVDGAVTASCAPASGSAFPVGNTTVTCSAVDAQGNEATGSFVVTVTDGVAPVVVVTPAGNRTVEATSAAGAVVTFAATATDNRDAGLTATCSPASGATFPIGVATLVTCSATDLDGNVGSTTFTVTVVDTTAPTLTLPAPIAVTTSATGGIPVTFAASATDIVDGSVTATCAPASGSTFAVGTTTVTCSATDSRGNTSSGSFSVTVTRDDNAIGRFVVFSHDNTRLLSNVTVVSGDIGANEADRDRRHGHRERDDDRDDITVQLGERVKMQQVGSRVVGDTVKLRNRASVYDVVSNTLINSSGTVLGTVTSSMQVPYLTMPVFPTITAGTTAVTVKKKTSRVLAAGSYGVVKVESGATLILTGGQYRMLSLDVAESGVVLLRGASEVLIKRELDTDNKAKIVLDQNVPGLMASQMVFYVEGRDEDCNHGRRNDDGDEHGPAVVRIGQQNVVQANIYAKNGTVWLMSKTTATGAFIGEHVRVGQKVTLTLDSTFR